VRKQTLIMIVILFVLLIGAAVAQMSVHAPATPHPGPTSPGQLPVSASSSP
jgi:hypothetical protein